MIARRRVVDIQGVPVSFRIAEVGGTPDGEGRSGPEGDPGVRPILVAEWGSQRARLEDPARADSLELYATAELERLWVVAGCAEWDPGVEPAPVQDGKGRWFPAAVVRYEEEGEAVERRIEGPRQVWFDREDVAVDFSRWLGLRWLTENVIPKVREV